MMTVFTSHSHDCSVCDIIPYAPNASALMGALPNNGANMPLNNARAPSFLIVFIVQSMAPVIRHSNKMIRGVGR
jgi:hypothetical protein